MKFLITILTVTSVLFADSAFVSDEAKNEERTDYSAAAFEASFYPQDRRYAALDQLKRYDSLRIRIDQDNHIRYGIPLEVQGVQLFREQDSSILASVSVKAAELRTKGRKTNRIGAGLTIGGFVGFQAANALIGVSSDAEIPGFQPTGGLAVVSLPTLIVGIRKLGKGGQLSAEGYQLYEKELRKSLKFPTVFPNLMTMPEQSIRCAQKNGTCTICHEP